MGRAVRERGNSYFRQRRVGFVDLDEGWVAANVRGTETYEVDLAWSEGTPVDATCTCPYFDRGLVCKHIWATILAAEDQGLLDSPRPQPALDLLDPEGMPFHQVEFDDLDDEEGGYDEEGDAEEAHDAQVFRDLARRFGPATAERILHHRGAAMPRPSPPPAPGWREVMESALRSRGQPSPSSGFRRPLDPGTELFYFLLPDESKRRQRPVIQVCSRRPRKNGGWTKCTPFAFEADTAAELPQATDREVIALLAGSAAREYYWSPSRTSVAELASETARLLLPRMAGDGRLHLADGSRRFDPTPASALRIETGVPWAFGFDLEEDGDTFRVHGRLMRGDEVRPLDAPALLLAAGWAVFAGEMAPYDPHGLHALAMVLKERGPLPVPRAEGPDWLALVMNQAGRAPVRVPASLEFSRVVTSPTPVLRVFGAPDAGAGKLHAGLWFAYGEREVAASAPGEAIYDAEARTCHVRDPEAEGAAETAYRALDGLLPGRETPPKPGYSHRLAAAAFPAAAARTLERGWRVEAEGRVVRTAGTTRLRVASGTDWFDLEGDVQFGEASADWAAVLASLRRGETQVELGDGTVGMLPEDWLKRYGWLADMGDLDGERLRLRRAQAPLIGALLEGEAEATADPGFESLRAELKGLGEVAPADPPPGFRGVLRAYQREGLGWIQYLQRLGLGGCLADDMGLGKTIQALAAVAARRTPEAPPSLVVAPRSLMFNWAREAERFAPSLRVATYAGPGRAALLERPRDHDLLLTTYGTLRRDILALREVTFDCLVLDEAQAIKNAATDTAKACRLLKGAHRLALSGTPIENHLGELWSLFEFLNPGMLGRNAAFGDLFRPGTEPDDPRHALLGRALRPFMLRRTKEQVATDLPARSEETIYCELPPAQRRHYNQLRDAFRASLKGVIEEKGLGRSKIMVLEALLRLRQAACHPALVDLKYRNHASAKLEVLEGMLAETAEEGHKTLVFSQFTSFLDLVRRDLDRKGLRHTYLDGRTRDREARVREFQEDPDCRIFLISLKAGGLGLNLTAADYVILLDPWWNPAVEAQAIDRAHRIGQTRRVLAYRIVAKDTVEEKILALQASKRRLADAIMNADASVLRGLTPEDLDLLLS